MLNVQSVNFNQKSNRKSNKQSFGAMIWAPEAQELVSKNLPIANCRAAMLSTKAGITNLAKSLATDESFIGSIVANVGARIISKKHPDRVLTAKDLYKIRQSSKKYAEALELCDEATLLSPIRIIEKTFKFQ